MWHRKACEFDQSESSAKSQEANTPMVPGTMTFSLFRATEITWTSESMHERAFKQYDLLNVFY
jgi:hypothetical protein